MENKSYADKTTYERSRDQVPTHDEVTAFNQNEKKYNTGDDKDLIDKLKNAKNSEEIKKIAAQIELQKNIAEGNLAKIRNDLQAYRYQAQYMDLEALATEKHDSELLGKNLRSEGWIWPGARWDAHHIVSGKHKDAVQSRLVLARDKVRIRVDDAVNGCWMPKEKLSAHRTQHKNAIPHANIHRGKYYTWLYGILQAARSADAVKGILLTVRAQLLNGNIKPELLQEIEDSCYDNAKKTIANR